MRFHTLTQNSFAIKYYSASYDPLQCTLQEQESKFNGRKINDTFTHTVAKGGGWKKTVDETVAHAVCMQPFFKTMSPFFLLLFYPYIPKITPE